MLTTFLQGVHQLANEVNKKWFPIENALLETNDCRAILPAPTEGALHIVVQLPPARGSPLPQLCMSESLIPSYLIPWLIRILSPRNPFVYTWPHWALVLHRWSLFPALCQSFKYFYPLQLEVVQTNVCKFIVSFRFL